MALACFYAHAFNHGVSRKIYGTGVNISRAALVDDPVLGSPHKALRLAQSTSQSLTFPSLSNAPTIQTNFWHMVFFYVSSGGDDGKHFTILGHTSTVISVRGKTSGSGATFSIGMHGNVAISDDTPEHDGTSWVGSYATDTWHVLCWLQDGTDQNVWVDQSLAMTWTGEAAKGSTPNVDFAETGGGAFYVYYKMAAGYTSATAADLTETSFYPEVWRIPETGNGFHDDWGDDVSPSTPGNADYTDVDDAATTSVGYPDGWAMDDPGASTEEQTATGDDRVITNSGDIPAVMVLSYAAGELTDPKDEVVMGHIVREDSADATVNVGTVSDASFGRKGSLHHTAPDASAWDQTAVNAIEWGCTGATFDDAGDILKVAGIALEVCAIGSVDPTPEIPTGLIHPRKGTRSRMRQLLVR